MGRKRSYHELRCPCTHRPLLATYGVGEDGSLYVHVKVFKSGRIYGEIYVEDGTVRLHCRDCLRWHRVIIRQPNKAGLREEQAPANVVRDQPVLHHD